VASLRREGTLGDTIKGGDTLMKINIFLRLNLEDTGQMMSWKGGEAGSGS